MALVALLAAACSTDSPSAVVDQTADAPADDATDDAGTEDAEATESGADPASPASDTDVMAAFAAAVQAGDRDAAAAIAVPEVIADLEPWEPWEGGAFDDQGGGAFIIWLEHDYAIGCNVGNGQVVGCAEYVPGEGEVDERDITPAERIQFPAGEFGTFLSGAVVLGERAVYVLEAAEGQSLILRLGSIEDNAVFDVFSPSGALLATEQTEGAILLPESGDYDVVVGGTRGNATYDLEVYAYAAQRIRFEAGATGATVSDGVVRGERAVYVLGAAAGQTMSVTITSVEDNAVFDLYPPSGAALIAQTTAADLSLPADGDYQIVVGGTRGNATYDLDVTIVN